MGRPPKSITETEGIQQGSEAGKSPLQKITKSYEEELGPYHTIEIPRGKKDPRYADVQILGFLKDGRQINLRWKIERGRKVDNVPNCAIGILKNAVEKNYEFKLKDSKNLADGEQGHEVIETKSQAYPFMVHESYPMRKSAPGPKVLTNNG